MNWKTKDGKILKLSEMTDSHLENSIAYKYKEWTSGDAFDRIGGEIAVLKTEKTRRIRERFFGQKSKCMCGGNLCIEDVGAKEEFDWPRYAWKCDSCPFTSCEIKMPETL